MVTKSKSEGRKDEQTKKDGDAFLKAARIVIELDRKALDELKDK